MMKEKEKKKGRKGKERKKGKEKMMQGRFLKYV